MIVQLISGHELEKFPSLTEQKSSMLLDAGYTKMLHNIDNDDRNEIIRMLFPHYSIYQSMAARVRPGLNVLGISN